MSYRWSQEGPAFEFSNPFVLENRFVVARCALLVCVALAMLVLVLATDDVASGNAALLRVGSERASTTPHVLAACACLLLALVELWRWLQGRKRLLLQPGQPASLTAEVQRESVGASAGAPWLQQALEQGRVAALPTTGPYRRALLGLSARMPAAPRTLHAELRIRMASLLLGAGLLLVLGGSWWLLPATGARQLAALWVVLLGGLFVARGLLHPERPARGPLAVTGGLVLALLGSVAASWLAGAVPQTRHLLDLGLPQAALALLVSGLLFDALALVAGRAQVAADVTVPRPAGARGSTVRVQLGVETGQLMQEIDRELLRRWTDGIPNRRHAWQPPLADARLPADRFAACVLEESQPLAVAADGLAAARWAVRWPVRVRWLLVLDGLGVVWTAAGGALWLRAAHAQSQSLDVPWPLAASGAMLVVAGGYALRVGHLLWSRTEATSTLIWLAFNGAMVPARAAPAAAGNAVRDPAGASIDTLELLARVMQARSVFYAAAPHGPGSRTVLWLADDAAGAAAWTQHVQNLARSTQPPPAGGAAAALGPTAGSAPAARAADAAARPRGRDGRPEPGAPDLPVAKPAPRFCSACGTPLLQGARFCQQCGNVL